jgi:hypothetical protein
VRAVSQLGNLCFAGVPAKCAPAFYRPWGGVFSGSLPKGLRRWIDCAGFSLVGAAVPRKSGITLGGNSGGIVRAVERGLDCFFNV